MIIETGSLTPFSGMPFATLFFDAAGKGSFDADITTLKINGLAPTFVDPAPYGFSILGESIATQVNSSVNGTYKPLDSFFTPSYTLKSMPQHGGVVFGEAENPSVWKYTPASGFYGQDTFTLRVSDPFDTKEKTYSIDVSPVGTSGNDTFHSSAASYHTDGGAGLDTITYTGKVANFEITGSQASAVITDKSGAEGVNHLDNFERLMFSDGAIALDIAGNGGQAYRLYQAAFDRVPDASGLGFWIHYMDGGMSLNEVAAQFMASLEFKTLYGDNPGNAEFIDKLYHNVLHRTGDQSGVDFWMNYLTTGGGTQAKTLAFFGESPENQAALIGTIGHGFTYTPYG